MNIQAKDPSESLRDELARLLLADYSAAEHEPFLNPVLHFAARLGEQLDKHDRTIENIEGVLDQLTTEAFVARAERLGRYLGTTDPVENAQRLSALFDALAERSFEDFQALVGRAVFGVVFTAHPTFALSNDLSTALVELATGCDVSGAKLSEGDRAARIALAERLAHRPPADLTLDIEHRWSVVALRAAHDALETIYGIVLQVARKRWPERWTELSPKLLTLASWVGYDQDGRTDIRWTKIIQLRLLVKELALQRHRATIADVRWDRLAPVVAALDSALATVREQLVLLENAQDNPAAVPAFAQALVRGRNASLAEAAPLVGMLETLVPDAPDDIVREKLLIVRSSLKTHGLSLAHTHMRLNAVQLHNAIRRQVGLETAPNDPTNRRSYFAAINDLIANVTPVTISFASVMEESASARRLMMTTAQIVKHVDNGPVRFLIAETESAFTLLTALYYAKLFGIEDNVEISPLFETADALDRGELVIEEALKSPHYVAYIKRQGRITLQFGYSDSGRFIGQMAATFCIERLRLRIAQLLERNGLSDLEVVLFNTHGESIGRGAHPISMPDRLRYLIPPVNRWEYVRRGIRTKEEISFQGGDGFLFYLTPPAALASLADILAFALERQPSPECEGDPIYADPNYAAEFFATIEQEFEHLVANPEYTALLDLFGGHLLFKTGSRAAIRQTDAGGAAPALHHPAELRAIPNNARLQQLAYPANTLFGLGRAAIKDKERFLAMFERSPRFRRALAMTYVAAKLSDLDATRAYAATVDPGAWLQRAGATKDPSRSRALRALSDLTEHMRLHDGLARVVRDFESDYLLLRQFLSDPKDTPRRQRVKLLHAIRVVLIQRICLLAMQVQDFSPQHGTTLAQLQARLIRLDIPAAIELLAEIFPMRGENTLAAADFGEPATYRGEAGNSYAVEHETVLAPIRQLFGLILKVSAALNHECNACG